MSASDVYQGINCYNGPVGSGMIMVPENIPHYYMALTNDPNGYRSILQVVYAGPDSQGTVPPPPAKEFQAPTYHQYVPIVQGEPKCAFGPDGICTVSGYSPGNVWYNVGDRSEHPSGNSPNFGIGVNMIAQGLALVAKG